VSVATVGAPDRLAVGPTDGATDGATEPGRITVSPSVVGRIAARAALDVPDAGAAVTRLLGQQMSASPLAALHVRQTRLDQLPKVDATVDGSLAFVTLTISVRYPAAVRQVAAQVRERVRTQIEAMTGLRVAEVDIRVEALATTLPPSPRVV